jgi:hypothetical protein
MSAFRSSSENPCPCHGKKETPMLSVHTELMFGKEYDRNAPANVSLKWALQSSIDWYFSIGSV